MMTRYVLSSLLVAALFLGGCGSKTTQHIEATAPPKGFVTLEEAQKQVTFPIVLPDQLPHGMIFDHAFLDIDPNTNKAKGVLLNFTGPDKYWSLEVTEWAVDSIPQLGKDAKELTVNGHKARFVSSDKIASFTWTDGKLVYITHVGAASEFGSEAALVDIAMKFQSK